MIIFFIDVSTFDMFNENCVYNWSDARLKFDKKNKTTGPSIH